MRRPEGLRFGKFSILGGVDLSAFLTKRQVREVAGRHPEFESLLPGQHGSVGRVEFERPEPAPQSSPAPAAPARHRYLPVVDASTGLRDCRTCPAPCCMILAAALTPAEAASGRYEKVGPDQQGLYYMPRPYGRCTYLTAGNACSIYDRRPAVCRDYRCDFPKQEDERVARWFLQRAAQETT